MSWIPPRQFGPIAIASGDFRMAMADAVSDAIWERVATVHPDAVTRCARQFAQAGADMLVAFTDRLSAVALAEHIAALDASEQDAIGLARSVIAACRAAVEPAERRALVFAAVGSVEASMSLGEVEEEALVRNYSDFAAAAVEAGVDGFLCRSFSELDALRCAVRGIRTVTKLPVIGSMTFDAGHDSTDTAAGTTIPEACRMLSDEGADVVGSDRGEYPDGAAAIVSLLAQSGTLPVYVEVNAGRPEIVDGQMVYPEPPAEFGERLIRLSEAGAAIAGGGHGAGVEHIAALNRVRTRLVRKGPTPRPVAE